MTADKMTRQNDSRQNDVDKIAVNEMSEDKIAVNEMTEGEMTVYKMIVDKMTIQDACR